MIEFKEITERTLDLDYEEEFEIGLFTYKIKKDNILQFKSGNIWGISDYTLIWVYAHQYELKKLPQKPFWAEDGDKFWYIDVENNTVEFSYFNESSMEDRYHRKLGNCFKTYNITKEQIKEYLNKLNNKEIL